MDPATHAVNASLGVAAAAAGGPVVAAANATSLGAALAAVNGTAAHSLGLVHLNASALAFGSPVNATAMRAAGLTLIHECRRLMGGGIECREHWVQGVEPDPAAEIAVLLIFVFMIVAQALLFQWRRRHLRSYQLTTLLGLWIIPAVFSLQARAPGASLS